MNKQIYLNIPVKDLNRSIEFFTALGYTFNPDFTDEKATAMIVSPDITIMLLTEAFYKTFMKKEIADTSKTNEMIIAVNAESREAVDNHVKKAFELGAKPVNDSYDYGWMYGWSFEDLDGHVWEVLHLDQAKYQASKEKKSE
jgi:predicted lactoylglutathione lyase